MPAEQYEHLSSNELSMANEAFITGELVRWARERSGLSYADIAKSLHVDIAEVRAWEEGESYPAFGKAQNSHGSFAFRSDSCFCPSLPPTVFPSPTSVRSQTEHQASLALSSLPRSTKFC